MFLTLSLVALLLGPLLYRWVERQPRLMGALDAFIFVAIGGLVLLHMLPDILESGGWWSLLFLALGMSVPTLLEKAFRSIAKQAHAGAMLLAALGLGLHGMTDGAALAEVGGHDEHHLLSLGVVLHRLPVGLTIWWLLRPHFGIWVPLIVLSGIAASTLLGHSLAEHWLTFLSGEAIAWFEALVVGTILHVVFHRPYHEDHGHAHTDEEERQDWLQGVGSLLGVAVLLAIMMPYWLGVIEHGHHHDELLSHPETSVAVLDSLLELSLTAAPWLLLAYLLGAMINFWFPRPFSTVYGPSVAQALRGAITGLPLPICVPNASKLYKMLIKQGAGSTYAMAFLMASPLLGIDAVLLTWGMLGGEWALWRTLVVLAFALIMALLIGRWLSNRNPDLAVEVEEPLEAQFGRRLQKAIRHGYAHLIDHTAPWVIAGLIVAALLPVSSGLSSVPLWPVFLLLLCLCLPFHLCATGMTPVIAVLLHNGLAPEIALVILLVGPAVNWSLIKLIAKLHGKPSAILTMTALVTLTVAFAVWMPSWPHLEVHFDHHHSHSYWHYGALGLVILLYAGSILRRGARSFMAELLPTGWLAHKH